MLMICSEVTQNWNMKSKCLGARITYSPSTTALDHVYEIVQKDLSIPHLVE